MLQDTKGNWNIIFLTVGAVYLFGATFFAIFAKGEILFGATHEKEEEDSGQEEEDRPPELTERRIG